MKGLDEDRQAHQLEQIFHLAPLYRPGEAMSMVAGSVSISPERIRSENAGDANIAILPVDPQRLQVRAQKGETSPAVGWYGVLGEFPAWDVTLECKTVLPARMDAVLFPLASRRFRHTGCPAPASGRPGDRVQHPQRYPG